jgi:hypothetical protein
MPEGEERQCRAVTAAGERCRQWSVVDGDGLCWLHAHPEAHPQLRHGYYRGVAGFGEEAQAAIRELVAAGKEVEAEVLVRRMRLWGVMDYLQGSERPLVADFNSVKLLFYECGQVGQLVAAQQALRAGEEADWVAVALGEMEEE